MIQVCLEWHDSNEELPEEGREVVGVDNISCDDTPEYGAIMTDMYYLRKGTLLRVERDRSFCVTYAGMKKKTAEERLLEAIFGGDDDIQEIESDGWYTFDTLNEEKLMRYRRINDKYAPKYWCYLTMPDKTYHDWRADKYESKRKGEEQ